MKPLKNWLSFEDQLRKLKGKGLHVDDDAAALDYLERIGYYRLSGYWYPMLVIDLEASRREGQAIRKNEFSPGSRNVICPNSQWAIRFRKLLADDFPKESTSLSLADMGICSGWEEWPLWYQSWR